MGDAEMERGVKTTYFFPVRLFPPFLRSFLASFHFPRLSFFLSYRVPGDRWLSGSREMREN